MSIFLYRLGGTIGRHRGLFVGAWLLVLLSLVGGASMLGDRYDDSFSIPGTESQEGQDLLADRFGATGTSGQILFTATAGKITDTANANVVAQLVKATNHVPGVAVSNPLTADTPLVNQDKTSTLAAVRFSSQVPSDKTLAAVQEAGTPKGSSPVTTSVGGDAYKTTADPSKVPELLGLMVSFMILVVTFASLLSAGMPILTALIGVGVTLSAVIVTSQVITVSSTAPTLAEMLGLAVGIDYALFRLSRHRAQLADGLDPVESMSRALATAGSAVMFAGATVIIALAGLSVAQIPVLTVMGLGAAAAVTVAVCIALTLLPAIALLFGERLRPRPPRVRRRRSPRPPRERRRFSAVYVHTITRRPIVTVTAVVVLLGLATVPAMSLELALPDNSTAPTSTPQRQTYDAITRAFGEGYNSPLTVTANVITTSSPKDAVNDLADGIRKVPGVVAVPQATPNQSGDTALIQAIPKAGQTDPSTAELVRTLRSDAPALEKKYKVSDILVTGQTAINIDASDRLGAALVPFASIVIGLSLILLMIVFRSLAVPVKATLGYLLSVGTALGAVVVVFQWGWLDGIAPGLAGGGGPVVSFLPIFVMGVLFGLAMDYEMFLVSAMREHFVTSGDAHEAVVHGFGASSRVVTTAALIMTSVFVAFIPAGTSTIQQIALGLAVGVFVDAFVVRMTLVPAVLMLLGRRAWWLPDWLERALPVVDVEGAALHRRVAYDTWESENGAAMLLARDLVVREGAASVELVARPGEITAVASGDVDPRLLAEVLAGRRVAHAGELVVARLLLPEQREAVARHTSLVAYDAHPDLLPSAADRILDRARATSLSRRRRTVLTQQSFALADELRAAMLTSTSNGSTGPGPAVDAAVVDVALALAAGVDVFVVTGVENLTPPERPQAEALQRDVARRGATVVVVGAPAAAPPGEPSPHVPADSGVLTGSSTATGDAS